MQATTENPQPFRHLPDCRQCAASRALRCEGWLQLTLLTAVLLVGFAYAGLR